MKFGLPQQLKFGVTSGTYSEVTRRENIDSQITATDDEIYLITNHFGKDNIFRGNVTESGGRAAQSFLLYPHGQRITLNLVFPKPEKQELRLYLSARSGFKPEGGSIWFLFLKDNMLWIGSMSELEWRSESRILTLDDSDIFYQNAIVENEVRPIIQPARDTYARNPAIALSVFNSSMYQCEFDASHTTFISRSSNTQYMEAHHLIPMSSQKYYQHSLDSINNVFCLCPNCHRAIHYSIKESTRDIIERLLSRRPKVLEAFNMTKLDLYKIYSVEDIDRG